MISLLSIGLFASCLYVASTAPPSPPDNVRIQQCRQDRAQVSWEPGDDNGSPITRYFVEYNTTFAPANWTRAATVPADVTEATVQLSPFANFTFRVIAQNNEGESQPSQRTERVCRTNPETPYHNPRNVHTDRSKPGVLIVKWDPMPEIEQNGPGFRYTVTTTEDGRSETRRISDWRQNQVEINYRQVYSPVEIKVEASNSLGDSLQPAAVLIGYTGEDYPYVSPTNFELAPDKEMTSTSAWFQWDPVDPSPEAMRGEFHGYKIRFWKGNDREEVMIPRAPPRDLGINHEKETAMVQNLYPNSIVHVEVVAVNTYYSSMPSYPITIQTPEGVPGPVEFVRVLVRGDHLFIMEWGKPKEPNGIITGYEISIQEIVHGLHVGEVRLKQLNDPSQTRALLDGLTPNRQYRIYVRALTRAGQGEQYFIDVNTAEQGHYVDSDTKCNSSISGPDPGEIASYGSPCFYSIQAGEGKLIELDLVENDFGSRTCEQEGIQVFKGLLGEERPLVILCTNTSTGFIRFRESAFFISYQIGPELSGSGFRMKYRFIPENSTRIPEITHFPVDTTSDEGETIEFYCSGDDRVPSVRWSWKKQEGTLDPERMQILADNTLRIENVEASDAGLYICSAENILGSDEAVAKLTVEYAPTLNLNPKDQVVARGGTVTLQCRAMGNPNPAIFWRFQEYLMFAGQEWDRFSVSKDGTLQIENVEESDEGQYTCKATNSKGENQVAATIIVSDSELQCGDGLQGMTFTSGDSSQHLEFATEDSLASMDFKGTYKFACDCNGERMICAPMTIKFGWK